VVVITGASSGIGRSAAHQLAAEGASLVLAARSADTLEQVRQECRARGAAEVVVRVTDVADREGVDALVAEGAALGPVDGVVHCAGVLAYGRFVDVPAEDFDRVLQTNVVGAANVARSALRLFEEQGRGSLVVVGSVLGKIATPYMSNYVTSKWALQGLVRALQIETRAQRGVHVTLLTPGGVDTPIYDQAGSYLGRPGHPPPPVASPEKVAAAAVRALRKPGRDVPVGAVNWLMVTGFRVLPGVFDVLVTPMMQVLGLGRRGADTGPGNVHEPRPEGEAVHGRWPHVWG
jgi:short-subunit dehydrogenase